MSRRSGKTVAMIQMALEADGVILCSNQARADDIVEKAMRLGVKPPKVVVFARGQQRGISIAELLVDHQEDCRNPNIEKSRVEAVRHGIKANSVILNSRMVYVPGVIGELPAMICGLDCYVTRDELPEGYSWAKSPMGIANKIKTKE